MKLSEAIRLGALMKPQAFGELWDGKGTCAWGAAYDAIGELFSCPSPPDDWMAINDLMSRPQCRCGFANPSIIHLNDAHRLTREEIADIVEEVENEMEAKAQEKEKAHDLPVVP